MTTDTMTFDQFLAKVNEGYEDWARLKPDGSLSVEWTIAGQDGGNCYGRDPSHISPEPEPEFVELYGVLERTAPGITFLQHRRLMAEHVNYSTKTHREYYGNWSEVATRSIGVRVLYDALSAMGVLCPA